MTKTNKIMDDFTFLEYNNMYNIFKKQDPNL